MVSSVDEPHPLIAAKPSQVTSDYYSASDAPREKEEIAMATVNHTGPVTNDDDKTSATGSTEEAKEVCVIIHTIIHTSQGSVVG